MENLQALLDIIELEQIDNCLFRGQNYITPWGRVFGGQVLAQSLNAAYRTVPEDRIAHSLHGYFILGGDVKKPVIYTVDVLRDGRSFTTRRVTASQNGKAIFVMAASFQLKQKGLEHQIDMPKVTGHQDLLPESEQAELIKDMAPDLYMKIKVREQNAIDFRPMDTVDLAKGKLTKPIRKVWMKLSEKKKLPIQMQHQLLAYASDYDLLLTAVIPHRPNIKNPLGLFAASLDHAMWFHRDFDFSDWLLYDINSPSASDARAMGHGSIFDGKGRLVSTVIQEGLIRVRP